MSLQRFKYLVPALLLLTWLLGMLPGSAYAATSEVAPSDAAHPYVMQQAANDVANAQVGTLAPFQAGPKMVAVGGAGGGGAPQREVFGFALASSLADPSIGYTTWNFSLLTTVAYFGIHVQDDGSSVCVLAAVDIMIAAREAARLAARGDLRTSLAGHWKKIAREC